MHWYKHSEALLRMESIWRAWEHLRPNRPDLHRGVPERYK
ncbi:DUF4913 domain-containing protein [Arthrobacter sp. U41]